MENILFKQSFRGFDRNQVLEYIDGLSNEMSRQAENYNKIQKGLEEEIRTLSDKLSLTGENLNVSQEKVVQLAKNLEEIKQDNIELKNQISANVCSKIHFGIFVNLVIYIQYIKNLLTKQIACKRYYDCKSS